jgi:hypothetical protein
LSARSSSYLDETRPRKHVEKSDGGAMSAATTEKSPRLAAHMVRCHEQLVAQLGQQAAGFAVMLITVHPRRHPERRIDEDQCG